MSRPTILVQMLLAGSWVDITAYVHLPAGISVTRGRDNEQGSPSPGTLSFAVKADGGRFVIDNPAAPAPFNAFKRWTPVRYSIDGVDRFTGYVTSAPATWRSSQLAQVQIVCVDLLGLMAQSPTVRSWTSELIAGLSPLHWWTLADSAPTVTAQPSAGGVPLVVVAGAGGYVDPATGAPAVDASGVFAFGQAGGSESDTQIQLKIAQSGEGLTFARAEATLGCTLQAAMPAEFTVLLVYTPTEPQGGREVVWRIAQTGGIFIRVEREGTDLVFVQGATEMMREPWFFVPPYPKQFLIAVQVTATKVRLVNTGHEYDRTLGALGSALFVLGPSEGLYSQAAICDGLVEDWQVVDLEARILGGESLPVSEWLSRAIDEAGIDAGVVVTEQDTPMLRPQLKGSNPAAIAEVLAQAADAMCVAGRSGALVWIARTYLPAVVDLVEPLTTDARWDADASLYYTEVQVDGATQASSPTNTFPKRARELPDLLPGADQQALIAWLANSADVWAAPRVSGLVVNLWPLSAARTAVYLALDLKSRIRLTTLPDGMPTPMVATVEGYTETVTSTAWTLAINTAPDPRFVLGATPAGVLGSNYRLL